jgi:hypothetical protein
VRAARCRRHDARGLVAARPTTRRAWCWGHGECTKGLPVRKWAPDVPGFEDEDIQRVVRLCSAAVAGRSAASGGGKFRSRGELWERCIDSSLLGEGVEHWDSRGEVKNVHGTMGGT